MSALTFTTASAHLPVILSDRVRRALFLETGREPNRHQVLEIPDLADLSRPQRERVIDLQHRCGFRDQDIVSVEDLDTRPDPRWECTSLEWVHRTYGTRNVTIYLPDDDEKPGQEPFSVNASEVFFAGQDGRTRRLLQQAAEALGAADVLDAWLDDGGALIDDLNEPELAVDAVLNAYERAITVARELQKLAREGLRPPSARGSRNLMSIGPDLIYIGDGTTWRDQTVGLVRATDPEAFDRIAPILQSVDEKTDMEAKRFVEDCARAAREQIGGAADRDVVDSWLLPYAEHVVRERDRLRRDRERQARYEEDRAAWISEHGSSRLRKAAARDFKHDALYRDERLAIELPGFFAAKVKKVGEPINPTEEAIDLEDRVWRRLKGSGLTVDLVWVVFDDDHDDGPHVRVNGFLGRHVVYMRAETPG